MPSSAGITPWRLQPQVGRAGCLIRSTVSGEVAQDGIRGSAAGPPAPRSPASGTAASIREGLVRPRARWRHCPTPRPVPARSAARARFAPASGSRGCTTVNDRPAAPPPRKWRAKKAKGTDEYTLESRNLAHRLFNPPSAPIIAARPFSPPVFPIGGLQESLFPVFPIMDRAVRGRFI